MVVLGLGTGGAERSIVDMVPHLETHGIDVTISCRRSLVGAQADVDLSRVHFSQARTYAGWVRLLRRLIREQQPDIVHTTLFEADVAGRLAAIGTGIPVLTSLVNMSYEPSRLDDPNVTRWKLELVRWIEGFTARRQTAHFHAITTAVKHSAVRSLHIPPENITVVHRGRDVNRLGVPTPERAALWRAAHGLGDEPVVLVVGRQEHQKGHDLAIRAMDSVRERFPMAKMVLVGRAGNATQELEAEIVRRGLERVVVRTGHVADVGSALCGADVLLFPSRFEGLGGVLLEALAMRTPIVASDIPPVREIVGGVALLVPPQDVSALASGIISTLEDAAAARARAIKGKQLFDREFRIEHVAARMSELYRRLT